MRKILLSIFVVLAFSFTAFSQNTEPKTQTVSEAKTDKPKRKTFRATKAQITQAQKMLKVEETGKTSPEFKEAVKKYQSENGLKATGSLNRATLEKMNIELTDAQKEIPVSDSSYAKKDGEKSGEVKKRGPVFRANKDQISEAQKMLKSKGMYAGEQTGKLDEATREAIKKFQETAGIKATGTLNKVTLEKMGIALTDKQKEM